MVFVNDKKYACETCIKGHRSSTCNHTERPLFEIKKKGRPITQCEHCRELRKTKQVHVKCLCEGRDDSETVSHSIPAKKANRKGPPPSAAFPFGLHPSSASASDSEDVTSGPKKTKTAQKHGDACACQKHGSSPCHCCTPRHLARVKRSLTPPSSRPKIGDIRATAPLLHRPSSEGGDAHERLQQQQQFTEPEPHALTHGHGARITHGSSLFNPYGHAHDVHLRLHDMRNHEPISASTLDSSNGYIYPVPPISYSQQQPFSARSEPAPMWSNGERISEDVNNVPASYDTQDSDNQQAIFGTVDFGSVDVDAWLREIMVSNSNPSSTDVDVGPAHQPSSNVPYTDPQGDPHVLPVPQALDVSRDLAQSQDPDYAPSSRQFDLLPRLTNLDLDYNDAYLSESEQDIGDTNGMGTTSAMFDSELVNYAPTEPSSAPENASGFFSTASDSFSGPAPPSGMLTLQACGNGEFRYAPSSGSALAQGKSHDFAFEYFTNMSDPDYVIRPPPGLPALTRSSSIGSHSSSRSRSSLGMSYWARNGSSDCLNANGNNSDQWRGAQADNASYPSVGTAESSWALPSYPSVTETARGWPASRVQAFALPVSVPDRGRAPRLGVDSGSAMDVSLAKSAPDGSAMSFN